MITEAVKGMLLVYVMYVLKMFSAPVMVGLCLALALAAYLDYQFRR